MSKPFVIGITGRTGSGKSLSCQIIKDYLVQVEHIDCDVLGHQALEKPSIQELLRKDFGPDIFENNAVSRPKLREIVFHDKEKLIQLNHIVHPEICIQVNHQLKDTIHPVALVEGALIHQVGLEETCDITICIDSPTKAILDRRPDKDVILNQQPAPEDYMNMCTHTIKNNTSIELFEQKIIALIDRVNINR